MKTLFKLLFFAVTISVISYSCSAPKNYWQVAHIKSMDEKTLKENGSFFSVKGQVTLLYDFWSEYGQVSFFIINNSEEDMTIHLDKSFFIRNGVVYDYYTNINNIQHSQTMTTTGTSFGNKYIGTDITSMHTNTSTQVRVQSNTIEIPEIKTIIIPAKASRNICKFKVSDFFYRNCDLYMFYFENLSSVSFTPETSPLVFENRLAYTFENSGVLQKINNKFYIDKIANMEEKYFLADEWVYKFCEKPTAEELVKEREESQKSKAQETEQYQKGEKKNLWMELNNYHKKYEDDNYDEVKKTEKHERMTKVKVELQKDVDKYYIHYTELPVEIQPLH